MTVKVRTISSRGKRYVQVIEGETRKVLKSFGRESPESLGWAYKYMGNIKALQECLEKGIRREDILAMLFGPTLGLDEVYRRINETIEQGEE